MRFHRDIAFISVFLIVAGSTVIADGPGNQWAVSYLGKATDSTNWLDMEYDANNTAYVAGSAGQLHIGGLSGWQTTSLPIHSSNHPAVIADDTGRVGVVYSDWVSGASSALYYQRVDGTMGAQETVYTVDSWPHVKAFGYFAQGADYPRLMFSYPDRNAMYFASKPAGTWDTLSRHVSSNDFTATHGGDPSNPYLIGADNLSGAVYLVRPQSSGYTTIIPNPGTQGLCASATSPDGTPTLLQVGGGVNELYVYTPGSGAEWTPQPTGLYPVFDYVPIRELCDIAFLSDGRMVIAYWRGDEKAVHFAIGQPGNWQDTKLVLPTDPPMDQAVDLALAVNDGDYPGLVVMFRQNDIYYIENIPEPATLSLLALGACLPLLRRRSGAKADGQQR